MNDLGDKKAHRYVDLSEKIIATYYDEEFEEWSLKIVTIEEALSSCECYTVLTSIEPERKTGKWIPENTSGPFYCQTFVCSECGEMTRIAIMGEPRHRYCPHCGAKMEYDATN